MATTDHITVKYIIDAFAVSISFASLFDMAPKIASVLSCIWLLIQIGGWIHKQYRKWKQ